MSAGWDDDGFGTSGDPFGVSGDVFGRELGDVDPFGGHDSFGIDAGWDPFDDAHGNTEQSEGVNGSHSKKTSSGSRTSSRSAPDSPRKKKGKKPVSGTSSSSSNKGTTSSSKKVMAVGGLSPKPPKSPTRKSDEGTNDDRGRGRSTSSNGSEPRGSRSRSNSAGPGGREASTTNGKYRGTKADRKQQQGQGTQKDSQPPQASGFETAFGEDPFSSNRVDDGFGDFVAFPTSQNQDDGFGQNQDDGFGSFADFGEASLSGDTTGASPSNREKRPVRVRAKTDTGVTRQSMPSEDLGVAPPKFQSMRRNSLGHANPTSIGISLHSTTPSSMGNSTTRFRHARNRNGVMTRTRPSEQVTKIQESKDRRSAIKDSLLGALGGDSSHGEITLDNFLGSDRKSAPRRGNNDAASVHSAPAAIRAPPRSTRRLSSQDDHHSAGSAGTMLNKSRRYQRRMGSTPSGTTKEPSNTKEPLKLDLAELAKQGYIEVQDGKMRLVIDVEPG